MSSTLRPPSEYMPMLERLRKKNPYARYWLLHLESKTNRHPSCDGTAWGWYEIFPLEIEIGFWSSVKDDLKDVDIDAWNAEAKILSHIN